MENDIDDNILKNIQKPLALLMVSGLMIATAIISHYSSTPVPQSGQTPRKPILQQPEPKLQPKPQPPKKPEIKKALPQKTTAPMPTPAEPEKPLKTPPRKSSPKDKDETFIF